MFFAAWPFWRWLQFLSAPHCGKTYSIFSCSFWTQLCVCVCFVVFFSFHLVLHCWPSRLNRKRVLKVGLTFILPWFLYRKSSAEGNTEIPPHVAVLTCFELNQTHPSRPWKIFCLIKPTQDPPRNVSEIDETDETFQKRMMQQWLWHFELAKTAPHFRLPVLLLLLLLLLFTAFGKWWCPKNILNQNL